MTIKTFDYKTYLGKTLTAIINRPMGSRHPVWGFEYPLNYGYIPGLLAPDGEDQDVYVVGVDQPLDTFTGVCVAIVLRSDDVEDKLVLSPPGMSFDREQLSRLLSFQEEYFQSHILLLGDED